MQLIQQLRQVWEQLTTGQRTGLLAGCALIVVVAVVTTMWAGKPRYEILFANLDSADAGRIVDELRAGGHPYRIGGGGRTVLVPRDRVYELRLQLAAMGIPGQGSVGYEIFDKNTIGMTDFVQRLNYQRALEGELARTIEQLHEIDYARIHVVIPEPSLYTDEEEQPTASVLVRVHEGTSLAKRQVKGICYLVAAGVEGLSSDDVTLVDSHGKILNRQFTSDEDAIDSQRVELQRTVEGYLTRKALSMLDGVLGPGKALVQVSAELDFERTDRTVERYDGDNPVVRSEERTSRTGGDDESGESVVTNYEISRTVERVTGGTARIGRLSVAALVDGVYVEPEEGDGRAAPVYQPRSAAELAQLRAVIENAIGIDPDRGDRVTVETFPFDRETFEREEQSIERQERMRMLLDLANKLGVGLVVALVLLLARNFLKETRKLLRAPESTEEVAGLAGMTTEEIKLLEMQNQIHTLVQEDPQRVAHLVRAWLREERT